MIGQTISHYKITEKLGEGGMGVVYKAEDTKLKRPVALKFLAPHLLRDEEGRKRFLREAQAAAALDHPNICTVYEIDEADGRTFIVMAFLEGRTLSKKITDGPLKLPEAISIAIQMAEGLEAAHEKGITHRDIKPDNVMLMKGSRGLVKLMDFGLAQLAESSKLTREGTTLGTPIYMSPEQALGEPTDSRSDVWGLGVVLYEMVAGRPPFQGEVDQAVIYAIANEQHEPLTALRTGVPKELERIVDKCLAKDAEERYQHVTDLLVDLQACRRALEPGTPKPSSRATPVNRATLAAAGAVVVLAGLGLAWWLTRLSETAAPPQYKLTQITRDTGYTADPALSPDGRLLAYASDRGGEGNLDIWVQQLGGGEPIRLTTHEASDGQPSFSPDGNRIVFVSSRDGGGIYVIPALGGPSKGIVEANVNMRRGAELGFSPRFSPDGESISYSRVEVGAGSEFFDRVYIVPASGGPSRMLQSQLAVSQDAIWSPDGKYLLVGGSEEPRGFGRFVDYDGWIVPVEGGEAFPLNAAETLRKAGLEGAVAFTWLEEGNRILFRASLGDGARNLWQIQVSPDGRSVIGEPQRLTSGTGEDQPSASLDGRIAFTTLSSNHDLWAELIDPNQARLLGSLERVVTGLGYEGYPTLSADGRKLLYLSDRSGNMDVWLNDLTTGADKQVTISDEDEGRAEISPDGSRAAFTRREGDSQNLFLSDLATGTEQRLLEGIGALYSWLPGGKEILYYSPPPIRWSTIDVETGETAQLAVRHSKYPVHSLRFSPGGDWISLKLMIDPLRLGPLFVAPVDSGMIADEKQWIQITDKYRDGRTWWSPDGNTAYFLSSRDGFECIWTQRLDPEAKTPVGPPSALQHFHGLLRLEGSGGLGWGMTTDRLYLSLSESKGNIWLAEPVPAP